MYLSDSEQNEQIREINDFFPMKILQCILAIASQFKVRTNENEHYFVKSMYIEAI